ncbi:MAG TPA: FAA hydrolase family protein, partial [Dokdonella sp.]
MKLGSLKEGGRDGTLIVVDRKLRRAVRADGIAATLQQALDDWSNAAPRLNALYQALQEGGAAGAFD